MGGDIGVDSSTESVGVVAVCGLLTAVNSTKLWS